MKSTLGQPAYIAVCCIHQVTAEFKKATALIKPGPKTSKVWADLYAEIDKVRTKSGQGPAGHWEAQGSCLHMPHLGSMALSHASSTLLQHLANRCERQCTV